MSAPLAWLLTLDGPYTSQLFANHLRLVEMAQALRRRGFAPQFVAPSTRSTVVSRLRVVEDGERIEYSMPAEGRWKPPGWDLLWFSRVVVPWLTRLSRQRQPKWIFTNASAYAPVIAKCSRRNGKQRPIVHVDVMGLTSIERSGFRRGLREVVARRLLLHNERTMFAAADLITTVNEAHARLVSERFASPATPVVIRDACDPAEVRQAPAVDLGSFGVRPGSTVVVFVGQLIHRRLDDLMAAMASLPAEPKIQALVIGDGPDRNNYERQVAESERLKDRVIFAGFQERRVALGIIGASAIAYSDCWSVAGFPFKVFEYMSLGCAIVVEGKAQMREVLRDGKSALFYSGAERLGTAIVTLAKDPSLRHQLGMAARSTLDANHTLVHRRWQLDALLASHGLPDQRADWTV